MSGNPANTNAWADADVYIAPLGSTLPASATDPFPAAWQLVGLLDGDTGFAQARNFDSQDSFAWGGVLMKTRRRNFKQTVKWACFEDNDVVRDLVWPGSTAGSLKVPNPTRMLIAFETTDDTRIRRLISANEADSLVTDDIVDSEGGVTKYMFETTIYPTSAGVLFTEQVSAYSSI